MATLAPVATNETDLDRQRRVADEYRRLGYTVTFFPGNDELPGFLRGHRPDLLAAGRHEQVVVEVTRGDRMKGSRELERLAQAVGGHKGWRFELVVAGTPASDEGNSGGEQAGDPRPLRTSDIAERLSEASRLRQSGHGEAAHLLAWATVEALIRRVLASNGVAPPGDSPVESTKLLYSYGLVPKAEYDVLHTALRHRNRLVHGYRLAGTRLNTPVLLRVAGQLLRAATTASANGSQV